MSNWVPASEPPSPTEAIYNVFELKKQPEIVRYYHTAAGFPIKPTWIRAINNKQYASWPGLTSEIVQKYYPELEETLKGHTRKFKSGLRSTKKAAEPQGQDPEKESQNNLDVVTPTEELKPPTKKKEKYLSRLMTSKMTSKRRCIQTRQADSLPSPAEDIST